MIRFIFSFILFNLQSNLFAEINDNEGSINHYNKSTLLSSKNQEVSAFIDLMVKTQKMDKAKLTTLFDQVQYQPNVIKLIEKPAEKQLTWQEYRDLFIKPDNIMLGVNFWNKHHAALSKAEKEYGVSPIAIIGILGVETRFGVHTGKYRVIDALATLSFAFPRRAAFFKKELIDFLILSKKEKMDPLQLMGSYAGAMGLAQFMPSSFLSFAVDFNHNGQIDIWNSPEDAIGSIANYLHKHNWQRGLKIAVPAYAGINEFEHLLSTSIVPNKTVKEFKKAGFKITQSLPNSTAVRYLKLSNDKDTTAWLTTKNFYAITRYNRSDLYAMTVFCLGKTIETAYHNTILHSKNSKSKNSNNI